MAYLSPFIYKKEIVSFSELQNLAKKRSKGDGGEEKKGEEEKEGEDGESSEVERGEGRKRKSKEGKGEQPP